MLESRFQRILIEDLNELFPGCVVLHNDASTIQGFPDLTILYKNKWVCLECKRKQDASRRPNQEYYVSLLNDMSYSVFVYPENKEEVLHDIQQIFST